MATYPWPYLSFMFSADSYTLSKNSSKNETARFCFQKVFRTQLSEPGFVLLPFEHFSENAEASKAEQSLVLRQKMVELKDLLSRFCQEHFNECLQYQWLGRFQQQNTTRFHRDNAASQSFLMLGYEPSEIDSELLIADYPAYAASRGWSADNFFEHFNPLAPGSDELLANFSTAITSFNRAQFQIVLLNNSDETPRTLGVLHKAIVASPNASKPRVINSMMLQMHSEPLNSTIGQRELHEFLSTSDLSKAQY